MYYSASSVAATRLNCSYICYNFDLRGYVPGAVLRLPDSMELFYSTLGIKIHSPLRPVE